MLRKHPSPVFAGPCRTGPRGLPDCQNVRPIVRGQAATSAPDDLLRASTLVDVKPLRFPLVSAVALGTALLAPLEAAAAEHQWHLGADLGAVELFSPGSMGIGGGVHVKYGINDALNLVAQADVSAHPYRQWVVAGGGVGVDYVIDVLRWVPYVGALVGAAGVLSTDGMCGASIVVPCASARLNLQVPFGLDYKVSRNFSVGLAGRVQLLVGGASVWTLVGGFARAEYVWGF